MIISRCNDHHRHLSAPDFAQTFCIFAVCWRWLCIAMEKQIGCMHRCGGIECNAVQKLIPRQELSTQLKKHTLCMFLNQYPIL
jgi:hypothetical protein